MLGIVGHQRQIVSQGHGGNQQVEMSPPALLGNGVARVWRHSTNLTEGDLDRVTGQDDSRLTPEDEVDP